MVYIHTERHPSGRFQLSAPAGLRRRETSPFVGSLLPDNALWELGISNEITVQSGGQAVFGERVVGTVRPSTDPEKRFPGYFKKIVSHATVGKRG